MLSTKDIPLDYYIDETKKIVHQRNVSNVISRSIELLKTSGPYAATNYLISESNRIAKDSGVIKDTNLAGDYQERVDDFKERFFGEKHIIGIPSGINPIDEIFGGWQPGDFIIILGWSNVGKSYLALLFACHAWLNGYRPMYISLEMNKNQVGYRMETILGDHESFTNDDLTHGRGFSPQEYERWAKETFENKHPFYLITSDGMEGANQNVIRAKIDQYKPDLVVIDYFNLVENAGGSGNETEKAKTLSRDFKNIAVKSEVPIINIAAVTMKDGHGERPPEYKKSHGLGNSPMMLIWFWQFIGAPSLHYFRWFLEKLGDVFLSPSISTLILIQVNGKNDMNCLLVQDGNGDLMKTKSSYHISGEALDQETIIRLRPQIEDYVKEEFFDFSNTELYWKLNDKGYFDYEIHFFV